MPDLNDFLLDDTIGELCVEVLEAERLPKMDSGFGSADPYAIVLFEGTAARTSTIKQSRSPQWTCGTARAFRFPVRCPYSCVYVALKDEDVVGSNEVIGRVIIELGSLYARTQYDCWLPLARSNLRHPGRMGAVRLRYSVCFHSNRERILGYVRPPSQPTFFMRFLKRLRAGAANPIRQSRQ